MIIDNIENSLNMYATKYGLIIRLGGDIYDTTTGAVLPPYYNTLGGPFNQWNLFPVGRLEVEMPDVELSFVDIPGSDFPLDLTDALTGRPIYKSRKATFEFKIIAERTKWDSIYSEIARTIHGKRVKVVRMEEPDYYYEGRLKLASTRSDAYNGRIMLEGIFDPYKRNALTSVDDWLWDPFSFEHGYVYSRFENDNLKEIPLKADEWLSVTLFDLYMPLSPNFHVEKSSGVTSVILAIGSDRYELEEGDNIIAGLSLSYDTINSIRLISNGGDSTVSIIYRGGSL